MFPKLLALFIFLPLVELIILIKLGEVFGFWPTLGLVIVTGILGASMAKAQGFLVFNRIQGELKAGRIPAADLIDGLLILIGGIVLLTPGLLTDLCGFALLIPFLRNVLKAWVAKKFNRMVQTGQTHIFYKNIGSPPHDFD